MKITLIDRLENILSCKYFLRKIILIPIRIVFRIGIKNLRYGLLICSQELKFFKIEKDCKRISIEDFYKLLVSHEFIRNDKNLDTGHFKEIKEKYQDHIHYSDSKHGTNITFNNQHRQIRHKKLIFRNLLVHSDSNAQNSVSFPKFHFNFNTYVDQTNLPILKEIFFENCIFQSEYNRQINPNIGYFWKLKKCEQTLLSFSDCIFSGITTYVTDCTIAGKKYYSDSTNIFKNTFSDSGGWFVFDVYLDEDFYKPFSIKSELDTSFGQIIFDNCFLSGLSTRSFNLTFLNSNVINNFLWSIPEYKFVPNEKGEPKKILIKDMSSSPNKETITPKANWGHYEKIRPEKNSWKKHKDLMLKFKNQAKEQNDRIQESIFNREILICDHELIKQEPFLFSWQDRFTLGFNRLFTNYGTSWFRPLFWLLCFNLLLTLFITNFILEKDHYTLHQYSCIFIETLDPLLSIFTSIETTCKLNIGHDVFLAFIDLIRKVVFGIFLYEIIRVVRRFTRKLS